MPTQPYHDDDIGVTMDVPEQWNPSSTEQIPLVLFAPERNNFRANMTFTVKSLEPPTPEHFNALIEQTRRNRQDNYREYTLLGAERTLQDGFPGYIERYHWEDAAPLTQVFALILTGPQGLLSIHGTTLRTLEDIYIPQFLDIIQSLQFDTKD